MTDQLAFLSTGSSDAVISECGRYRYELTRTWDDAGPLLEWIMLNPSKANASINDPTIHRCITFAKQWGYGGIVVRNLFALRATNPQELLAVDLFDAFGPKNVVYLDQVDANCTIAAWGAHAAAVKWHTNGLSIKRPNLYCLGINANGSPKHPLYVPADRTPVPWVPA